MKKIDYKNIKNQIGCGYCILEETCEMRNPRVNTAKLGCTHFKHYLQELEELTKLRK